MDLKDQILARAYVVLTVLSMAPLLIAGQMVSIYLGQGKALRDRGEQQARKRTTLPAMRGVIKDQAGRTLVANSARFELALDPGMEGFAEEADAFYRKLARLTDRSAYFYRQKVRRRSSPRYVLLRRELDRRQKEEVASWGVPGVVLTPHFARRYNYGKTAAHVLGHVGADGQGLAGLELKYDDYLQGTPGQRVVARNRWGRTKARVGAHVTPPRHGQNLKLTIDLIRQTALEEELARGVEEAGARWGTAIAMDPETGAILAMANAPTYNPNRPAAAPRAARRNHAVTDRLEPGSTFKLVTAIAAIEQGVIDMEDLVETGQGWARIGGRTMTDSHANGTITFTEVIAQSSNIGTAKTALRLEPGTFYKYARAMGFGQPTWVDLPGEVGGTLKHPNEWSGTTQATMSIGYEVGVTPLQLLTAYCALANGGLLVQPHIVAERQDMTGKTVWRAEPDSVRRAFEKETARTLLPAFEQVVEDGTARRAQIEGLRIAGKTGTAKKVKGGVYRRVYRALFVGFFPADDPEVALLVVVDEPEGSYYGGSVAAPIFRRIAERWIGTFPSVAARVSPIDQLPEPAPKPVPDVTGQLAGLARGHLAAAGYDVSALPAEQARKPVARQAPKVGTPLEPGRQTTLTVASASEANRQATLPNLAGLSARQAAFWLRTRGVKVRINGSGQVVGQAPEAGSSMPEEVILQCE